MIHRNRAVVSWGAVASAALVAMLLASGCGSTDCSFTATCAGGSATADGGPDAVDGGSDAPADPCIDTPTDPKCLDESTSLFVSAAASDAGADGTRAHPFKTIGAALAGVNATRKRIYVCEGTYPEKVAVPAGASILGGLACDWTGKGANPRIAPPKGVALSMVKAAGAVVADVDVEGSADAQVPGDSAIAVFVSESNGVLFRRVGLKAGPGTNAGPAGANGDATPNYATPIAARGQDTASSAAAEAPDCGMCADATLSTGGKGAAAGGLPAPGTATPVVGVDNSGGTTAGACSDGKPGAPGLAGAAAAGADRPGVAKATGWDSALVAKKGANGNPAQGGGGGGGTAALGGGSGGCGGCGGSGGEPGSNGGSSFALLSFDSAITLENSTLTAGAGGSGADGGKGQDGQVRGGPGNGACLAGAGGHGAGGGGGGGGAGGHSAAIAHTGKPPVNTSSTLKPGVGGALGAGGTAGTSTGNPGAPGNPGAKGASADVLPL